MTTQPNVIGGSIEIDLRGIQEGTHPLVLDGGEATLRLDRAPGQELSGFRFEGAISSEGRDRRVRGFLTGTLETVCDRCLVGFGREVRAELDVPVVVEGPSREAEESPEGTVRMAPDAAVLDLTDSFRTAILLEVPMKNLCRSDCRGLCPRCGVNRNEKSCDCVPPGDPRWDALRNALKGSSPSSEPPKE